MKKNFARIIAVAGVACALAGALALSACGESKVTVLSALGSEGSAARAVQLSLLNAMAESTNANLAELEDTDSFIFTENATPSSASYPKAFDLRAVDTNGDGVLENYVTSVKNQSPFGSCWAFAVVSAAETSILYDLRQDAVTVGADGTKRDSIDLSEHQLAWFGDTPISAEQSPDQAGEGWQPNSNPEDPKVSDRMNNGGTGIQAAGIFASGTGPTAEPDANADSGVRSQLNYHGKNGETVQTTRGERYSEDDDWSVSDELRFVQTYLLEDAYFLPTTATFDDDGAYDVEFAERAVCVYKEQLMSGRAVAVSFCADTYSPSKVEEAARYINVENGTYAHYTYEKTQANHEVTIVGWDDTYSRANFLTEVQDCDEDGNLLTNDDGSPKMKTVGQPPADGAWIVKNSWGSSDSIGQGLNVAAWGVDGSGYFYLSYYDQSITDALCFDFDVTDELANELGEYVLEETDFLPISTPRGIETTAKVGAANVFTAEDNQAVRAVSCVTSSVNEEVTVEVRLLEGEGDQVVPGAVLSTYKETFESPGVHLVRLTTDAKLQEGQRYCVTTYQKAGSTYLLHYGWGLTQRYYDENDEENPVVSVGVVNAGESYVMMPEVGAWWDWSNVIATAIAEVENMDYLAFDNFSLKAYASIL